MRSRLAKKIVKNPERYSAGQFAKASALMEKFKEREETPEPIQVFPEPAITNKKPRKRAG